MLSDVNIGHPLFVLLGIHNDILLGYTLVIVFDLVGDIETKILEDRDAKYVSNPFFVQPEVDGSVLPLHVHRRCTCISVDVQESL